MNFVRRRLVDRKIAPFQLDLMVSTIETFVY